MSTYWYFECLDHEPAMRSENEFTQHTDDEYFQAAVRMAAQRPVDRFEAHWSPTITAGYFARNAFDFLRDHPSCRLTLVNEYDDHRELDVSLTEVTNLRIAALEKQIAELRATQDVKS